MRCGIPDDHVVDTNTFASNANPEFWDLAEAKIKQVHEKGITGKGVKGIVLDTGYSPHPLLRKPYFLHDITRSRSGVKDMQGHGSWCNGRVFAETCGIAVEAEWGHIKVLDDTGRGRTDWTEEGRLMAARNGAHVVSVSIGGPCVGDGRLEQSHHRCNELGTLLEVDAAGNAGFNGSNTIDCPGRALTGFAVGAYRRDGRISNFSSGGRELDVACPGEQVISTSHRGDGWATMSGTSMATPFFAGLMCLIIQKRRSIGVPDDDMTGAEAWRSFFTQEGLLEKAFEDAGQAGKDPRYGIGKPLIMEILNWLVDYENL